ncbi:conserved protein of unknown function [Pseudomonas sp. JV551A1]|uniref:Uncharacterized protein n=1 Tax=Pseudomonas inefficax TaxID=2078786 RepID=A0AAQ1P3K8_9PSED|nr:hypothetical protein [Pseudomonas]SPO53200.1 conserved protein of unknown function [Pseudomonas sp. JV551A1]SPO59179.1 conserved protein of unknown function [Pseudomonas inefficax]
MHYSIDFQQLHKGRERPTDDGDVVGVSFESEAGFALIPNVGDVVNIPEMEGHAGVQGVVKSRLFNYVRSGEKLFCGINIVVEERDDINWGALIKE